MRYVRKPLGWRYESVRHSLAAHGVRTKRFMAEQQSTLKPLQGNVPGSLPGETWVVTAEPPPKITKEEKPPLGVEFPNMRVEDISLLREMEKRFRPLTSEEREAAAEEGIFKKEMLAEAIRKQRERKAVEGREDYQIRQAVLSGATSVNGKSLKVALDDLRKSNFPAYASVQRDIQRVALSYAQAGTSPPPEFEGHMTPLTQRAVKKELEEFRKLTGTQTAGERAWAGTKAAAAAIGETGLAAGELGVKGVGAIAKTAGKGVAAEVEFAEEGLQGKGGGFFEENPLLSDKFQGQFKPLKDLEGKESMGMLSEDLLGPKAMGGRKTFNEAVDDEVNELADARQKLASVDLSPFKKGEGAFKRGDREGLIGAVNALEAQEQLIADRWNLVEQTRAVTLSPQARAQAYVQDNGLFGGVLFGGGGGEVLAERTKKLAEVKRSLKDVANELYARKKLLRYKLQRMDQAASVGDSSLPEGKIAVLADEKKGRLIDELVEKNPVLHPVGTVRQVFGKREE